MCATEVFNRQIKCVLDCAKSTHTTMVITERKYAFSKVSHKDACGQVCEGSWSNVTNTLKSKANAKLGWFGRPCSHIMQQADKSLAATVSCPSKKVEIGSVGLFAVLVNVHLAHTIRWWCAS